MERSLADLLVGRTLVGRYLIEEVIGRGGMSVVYRAADQRLGRQVGVKVISFPSGSADDRVEMRERLRREAASAARIPPHPNVVQVYDYGTDPELGVDFIAMELLRGRDLKSIITAGTLPLPEARHIIEEAARGVAAGHRAGIVHRDLKPSNIILVEDGDQRTLKILDFGIAKALEALEADDLTRTGHSPHSPAYASPEQLAPGAAVGPPSDVYQLGLLGYELLAGERPFHVAEQERIRAGEELPLPDRGRWSSVPAHVRDVIARALATAPERRYDDASAFARALTGADADTTLLVGEPVRERGVPITPASGGSAPRPALAHRLAGVPRRALYAGAAVVALLALWLITRSPGDPAPTEALASPELVSDEIDAELRALRVQAHQNLTERGAAGGEDAAQAVATVVGDLMQSWVDGEIDRHASHYAGEVSFYGQDAARAQVRQWRAETVEAYPRRSITMDRTAITFADPGHARVLLDKSWEFEGEGDGSWSGSARQELLLEVEDGEWRVVSERNVEVFDEEFRE